MGGSNYSGSVASHSAFRRRPGAAPTWTYQMVDIPYVVRTPWVPLHGIDWGQAAIKKKTPEANCGLRGNPILRNEMTDARVRGAP